MIMNSTEFFNDLEIRWDALEKDQSISSGVSYSSVIDNGNTKLCVSVIHPQNRRFVLLGFKGLEISSKVNFPEGDGFKFERFENPKESNFGWLSIDFKNNRSSSQPVSLLLEYIALILENLKEAQSISFVFNELKQRLIKWQAFMQKVKKYQLSAIEEIGLWGELSFQRLLINHGLPIDVVLDNWVGPQMAPHDYEFNGLGVEIKTIIQEGDNIDVIISSLNQLDSSGLFSLFLLCNKVLVVEDGETLNDLVDDLKKLYSVDNNLLEKFIFTITKLGYNSTTSMNYVKKFFLTDQIVFPVDSCFPRLYSGNVPVEVVNAEYTLHLSNVFNRISLDELIDDIRNR